MMVSFSRRITQFMSTQHSARATNTPKWTLFLTVILMDLLVGMEFDLFVPSFPDLQHTFGLSPAWTETLLSVNFLSYCGSLFFVGGLADRYGRRPIILLGLILFTFGSILSVWAPTFICILFGRFLQGVGIAAPSILSFLIIADSYPMQMQQRLLAFLNAAMNTAAGAAPVIGSYVALYGHWRANFIVLLILGSIVLALCYRFIPHYKRPEQQEFISWRSYLPIFQSKSLLLIIIHFLFMFVPYWIFVGLSPLLYIKDLGISLSHFGYYQGALALVFAVGCLVFGWLIKRFSQRSLLSAANVIFIISLISILFVSFERNTSPLWITLAMILFVIGQIIPSTILYPISLNILPEAKGRVSAIIQGGRLILSALSLQIAGYYYQHTFQNIGILISVFICIAILTLFAIMKSQICEPNNHAT